MIADPVSVPAADPPDPPKPSRPWIWTRNIFLTGLAVVMPVLATVFLLNAGLQIIEYIADQVFMFFYLSNHLPKYEILGVKIIPLLIMVVVIFTAGVLGAHAIGRRVIEFMDGLVLRVPLVSTVYSATKQVMATLRTFEGTPNFQYVVYIDFPAPGCRLIGFVTGRFHEPKTGRDMTLVFLPTTPNPITGFVLAVESGKVQNCPLSVEDATKLIVSAGLVAPSGGLPATALPAPGPSQPEDR